MRSASDIDFVSDIALADSGICPTASGIRLMASGIDFVSDIAYAVILHTQ